MHRGKQFEKAFKEGLLKFPTRISTHRIPDQVGGYLGGASFCDFIVFRTPTLYYLELKSRKGKYLSLDGISKNQFNGLSESIVTKGVVAGVVVWFLDYDITTFIPIQEIVRLKEGGAKSISIKDVTENKIIHKPVPSIKKRVLCTYPEMNKFLKELSSWQS